MNIVPGQSMDISQVEKLISTELLAGQQYVYGPDYIAAERDRNYDYRRGVMKDLPVPRGRSGVVDRTVAAYIDLMKPMLLRIFTSGRNVWEYVSPDDALNDAVKQITRYVNDVVFRKDNRGELMLDGWAEDGLVQKLGTMMGWWEDRQEAKDEIYDGIPQEALPAFVMEAEARGAEILEHTAKLAEVDTGNDRIAVSTHSLKVRTWTDVSKLCLDVIPQEEYIVSRDARYPEEAVVEAHRTGMPAGDLIAQGIPAAIVNSLPAYSSPYPDRLDKYNQDSTLTNNRDASADPSLKKVAVARGILRCNYDGTGIKEWFFFAGGDLTSIKLLRDLEPYNHQVFFANFCPGPKPHTIYGGCPADDLAEVQKVRTVAARQMLDSLYLAVTPQREVVASQIIKPDQLMNLAPGAPVLVKGPNAIREIAIPFVGREALGVLQYFEGEAEIRTGVGRNTAGLDPEALTNQSATANNNMFSAMQGRVEHIARIWAQGGMRKLGRGIFQCLKAYQTKPRQVQIDGKPVMIDPSVWAQINDLEVNVNTGLGTGNRDRDFAALTALEADQEKVYGVLGPDNPVVTLDKIVRTKQLKAQAVGISYPENFYGDPKNPDGSPWQPQPPAPPQPSPDTIVLAQVEQAKVQEKEREAAANLAFEREKAIAEIASKERIAMDKNAKDYEIGLRQLGIEHAKTIVQAAKVDAEMIRNDMMKGQAAA